MIFPTNEESDMRCPRSEKMLAITYGIGTELNKDLVSKDTEVKGCFSGKAKFFIPSTEKRFEMLINQFDALSNNDSQAKNALADKLNYYGIPLNKADRESSSVYAKRHMPWFKKLSKENGTDSLPLIASTSSSTARLLITLLHLDLFNKPDESFDLDKAQIVANCLMGYFVFCGHHSFLEVIEIWNRLLDYMAIYHADKLPKHIFTANSSHKLYIEAPLVERALPYARIGDYRSFLHTQYERIILERAKLYMKSLDESVACLGIFGSLANFKRENLAMSDNKMTMAKDESIIKISHS